MVFRQVRETFPSISLDTVNRTLLTLSDLGAAFVVEGSGDAKRFDANLKNHQHFQCVKCKRIIDFHHEAFDAIDIPENLRARFTVHRKTVYLEGYCDLCRQVKVKRQKEKGRRGSRSLSWRASPMSFYLLTFYFSLFTFYFSIGGLE